MHLLALSGGCCPVPQGYEHTHATYSLLSISGNEIRHTSLEGDKITRFCAAGSSPKHM